MTASIIIYISLSLSFAESGLLLSIIISIGALETLDNNVFLLITFALDERASGAVSLEKKKGQLQKSMEANTNCASIYVYIPARTYKSRAKENSCGALRGVKDAQKGIENKTTIHSRC